MAIRRAKQKAQVITLLQQQAPAGEQFIACIHCETGPSPWLGVLFDEVPLLGLIVQLTRKFYFLTLTNTSVVVNSASRFTNRPGPIVASFANSAFPISGVKRGKVWSVAYVQFAGSSKPTRLNIHRYWRNEFDMLVNQLPAQQQQAALAPGDDAQAS
jgi:hypothetical protein